MIASTCYHHCGSVPSRRELRLTPYSVIITGNSTTSEFSNNNCKKLRPKQHSNRLSNRSNLQMADANKSCTTETKLGSQEVLGFPRNRKLVAANNNCRFRRIVKPREGAWNESSYIIRRSSSSGSWSIAPWSNSIRNWIVDDFYYSALRQWIAAIGLFGPLIRPSAAKRQLVIKFFEVAQPSSAVDSEPIGRSLERRSASDI